VIFTNPFLPAAVIKAITFPSANAVFFVEVKVVNTSILESSLIASKSVIDIEKLLLKRVAFLVVQFEITLYNINTLTIDVSGNFIYTNETYTITIPPGNYTSAQFKTILNNIFINTTGKGLKFLYVDISIQINTIIRANNIPYDPSNMNYSPDFYFKINFGLVNTPLYKTAGWMMGFRKETYTIKKSNNYTNIIDAQTPIIYNAYLISESTYGNTIDNYIFLEIDDYHNNFPTNTFVSINSTSYIGKNILARIVLNSGANTVITDNAGDRILKKREYFGPIKLEKFRIRLINRFGDVIDINQNNYSFVLELKQLY
jgi:hypothetical protein